MIYLEISGKLLENHWSFTGGLLENYHFILPSISIIKLFTITLLVHLLGRSSKTRYRATASTYYQRNYLFCEWSSLYKSLHYTTFFHPTIQADDPDNIEGKMFQGILALNEWYFENFWKIEIERSTFYSSQKLIEPWVSFIRSFQYLFINDIQTNGKHNQSSSKNGKKLKLLNFKLNDS